MGLLDILNTFNGVSNVAESGGYNPKISVIMQSFLGDYPNSRSNPIDKFHRAVDSFLKQVYKNCELIIVSDGCEITEQQYRLKYQQHDNIKFVYVSKGDSSMYDLTTNGKFYRGAPRQAGIAISTGDIIAYMDSDDYITSDFTKNIQNQFYTNKNMKMLINRSWYDHVNVLDKKPMYPKLPGMMNEPSDKIYKFKGIDANFVKSEMNIKYVPMSPALISHVRTNKVFWEDTMGVSEDITFVKSFRSVFGDKVTTYSNPVYVICHSNLNAKWDV